MGKYGKIGKDGNIGTDLKYVGKYGNISITGGFYRNISYKWRIFYHSMDPNSSWDNLANKLGHPCRCWVEPTFLGDGWLSLVSMIYIYDIWLVVWNIFQGLKPPTRYIYIYTYTFKSPRKEAVTNSKTGKQGGGSVQSCPHDQTFSLRMSATRKWNNYGTMTRTMVLRVPVKLVI